ncbi:MAG: hypothetical protein GX410_00690 [Elusimicrobia bacterium]|nr:hypothetical protein [Elusimicrobiota bacterium]
MKKHTLVWLFAVGFMAFMAAQAAAQEGEKAAPQFTDTYWDLTYPAPQATVFHTLVVQVKDLDKALAQADKIMKKFKLLDNSAMQAPPQRESKRYAAWLLTPEDAEKAAQKLFALGIVKQYNASKNNLPDRIGEIDGKIRQLEQELTLNKAALENMPIAKFMLGRKLAGLQESKKGYEDAQKKARIHLTLIGEEEAFRQY